VVADLTDSVQQRTDQWKRAAGAPFIARSAAATPLERSTGHTNAPARALYHALGFRADDDVVRMGLTSLHKKVV
jgi:hypothetical protein